eukprot:193155-Pleurochrysis_carterae.AAC.1
MVTTFPSSASALAALFVSERREDHYEKFARLSPLPVLSVFSVRLPEKGEGVEGGLYGEREREVGQASESAPERREGRGRGRRE